MAYAHERQACDSEAVEVLRSWLEAGLRFSVAADRGACVVRVEGKQVTKHADPAQAVLWAVEELRCQKA